MTTRPRPLLAVRLIGPADVVAEQKARLLTHLADTFGDRANYRTSTRPPSYLGESRTYITVTAKTTPAQRNPLPHNAIPPADRQEDPL